VRALVLTGPRRLEIADVGRPQPGSGQVLLRVKACGVCGSDLNAWRGSPGVEYPLQPGQPGHEVWGEVAALGNGVPTLQVGQTATGMAQNGYAEYVVTQAEDLLPVAEHQAPLLGEPLACAANIVRRAAVSRDEQLAVVGFSYLTALVIQLMRPSQPWIAISRRPDSRDLARELGASATYAFDQVPSECWDSFPVVIEGAGVQQTLDYAGWLVAYGGRLVIAGYHADGPRTVAMQTWNWKGIDVVNAHERKPEVYRRGLLTGLEAVQQHRLELSRLVTHAWPLDRAEEAFTVLEQRPPGFIKGIVQP
jgi:threonine dehydrogenase-like Zn-dependent dehydrogenase